MVQAILNSDANQFNSSPIATSPLYTKIYKNSYPYGEGWGETWGKFAVPMVGGGGNMGEVHPRSAPPVGQSTLRFGQIPTNAPPAPGGGVGRIIDRCNRPVFLKEYSFVY
jgi:hypothetical protein